MHITNLTAGYGKKIIINKFSLEVNTGDRIIIAGPNGCGKTTLLKCILGIVKPVSGTISLEKDETIAYCKQDFPNSSFPITVNEVVEMGIKGHKNKELIESALKKTGVYELRDRLFYSLSNGERQKVSLARCYCQNAKLLLLDEPSSFLDKKSKAIFIEQMKALEKEPFAIIAVTHDDEIIKNLNWKTVRGDEWNV